MLDLVEKLRIESDEIVAIYRKEGKEVDVETVDDDDRSTMRTYESFHPATPSGFPVLRVLSGRTTD